MKYLVLLFFILFPVVAFSGEVVEEASIIQLIAKPESYDGKVVFVSGFLGSIGSTRGLYLTKEYARMNDDTNRILLKKNDENFQIVERCGWNFVSLKATFNYDAASNSSYFANVYSIRIFDFSEGSDKVTLKRCDVDS